MTPELIFLFLHVYTNPCIYLLPYTDERAQTKRGEGKKGGKGDQLLNKCVWTQAQEHEKRIVQVGAADSYPGCLSHLINTHIEGTF